MYGSPTVFLLVILPVQAGGTCSTSAARRLGTSVQLREFEMPAMSDCELPVASIGFLSELSRARRVFQHLDL